MAAIMGDLDGVFNEFVEPAHPDLCEHFEIPEEDRKPWLTWNHHIDAYGRTNEEFVVWLTKFAEKGLFTAAPPRLGTVEAIRRVTDAGHTLHIVTDRPEAAHDATRFWLDDHDFPYETLQFSRDKTVFMDLVPGPYYAIDDRVENVQALRKAGVNAFLLTWPWNAHADLPRVSSVDAFANLVLNIEGRVDRQPLLV